MLILGLLSSFWVVFFPSVPPPPKGTVDTQIVRSKLGGQASNLRATAKTPKSSKRGKQAIVPFNVVAYSLP